MSGNSADPIILTNSGLLSTARGGQVGFKGTLAITGTNTTAVSASINGGTFKPIGTVSGSSAGDITTAATGGVGYNKVFPFCSVTIPTFVIKANGTSTTAVTVKIPSGMVPPAVLNSSAATSSPGTTHCAIWVADSVATANVACNVSVWTSSGDINILLTLQSAANFGNNTLITIPTFNVPFASSF